MDNSIFELLKMFGGSTQPPTSSTQNFQNPAYSSYPKDAYNQNNNLQNSNSETNLNTSFSFQNIMPMLMSMMGKNGNVSQIMELLTKPKSQQQENQDCSSSNNINATPPKDEVLL